MEKSLWSVQFQSNSQSFGGGVVILDGNQAVGGDAGYYYIGQCLFNGNSVSATVTITKHGPGVSIFGNINSFKLILSGNLNGDAINFSGHVDQAPQMKISAVMKKLTNLS